MEERRRIVIYVGEADYKWIELQAGGNVSGWVREKILSGGESLKLELPVPDEVTVSDYRERKPMSSKTKTCKHGTAKGWNCWQCGGIANVE